jgi:aldose 1-epimerase
MSLIQEFCFTHTNDEKVYLFTLQNKQGDIVRITNYGAIITSWVIHGDPPVDIVLGFDTVEEYLSPDYLANYPYFGAVIGRYANRIGNGRFPLGDKQVQVTQNKGSHHLHGGAEGFDKKVWEVTLTDDSDEPTLMMAYTSKDGEEGFPGNLTTTLLFRLDAESSLFYTCHATTDQPTAVNLTHHSYFNLDGDGRNIAEHEVKIHAPNYLAQDEDMVVTGELIPVANTSLDFSDWKPIGEDWDIQTGYDQTFMADVEPGDFHLVAEAWSEKTGLHLQLFTTAPALHFYTGKWIPAVEGKNGDRYGPFSGFCFEMQYPPNAVNMPHFPSTLLQPGEIFSQMTMYLVKRL